MKPPKTYANWPNKPLMQNNKGHHLLVIATLDVPNELDTNSEEQEVSHHKPSFHSHAHSRTFKKPRMHLKVRV
jgi:hypothetical protein